ncbi:MAG TPA: carboxypeptidase-like regulatory domain-containing protein [Polyangia bacterium]|nr:carboxypeptidase-like regulatory domain-containing protein [Polyangia bacterium]
MKRPRYENLLIFLTSFLPLVGCGPKGAQSCDPASANSCPSGQVCELVTGGQPTCAEPLVVRGKVTDPSNAAIPNALVAAVDANDAPASGTATTDASGNYELRVPATRDANGAVQSFQVKLRASASGYETFPTGLERSLPLPVSNATRNGGRLVFEGAGTTIILPPLSGGASGLGSIAGTVRAGAGRSGALIVAEGPSTLTTTSDIDGSYILFNVPPGSYTVRGYAAGLQLASANATVTANNRSSGVDLTPTQTQLGSVAGTVNIVAAPGGSVTSVVLVVESTFNDTLGRGAVPPGLRAPKNGAPNISGAFTITDVPDGRYVVLAAFENDALVRDPSTIGGTQIQRVTVDASNRNVAAGNFKVTAALAVVSPGASDAPDTVTGNPTFVWADGPGEEHYSIDVFDSRGNIIWTDAAVPKVTGNPEVRVTYPGPPTAPALVPGQLYQFRAISYDVSNAPLSATEDLRGVFIAN